MLKNCIKRVWKYGTRVQTIASHSENDKTCNSYSRNTNMAIILSDSSLSWISQANDPFMYQLRKQKYVKIFGNLINVRKPDIFQDDWQIRDPVRSSLVGWSLPQWMQQMMDQGRDKLISTVSILLNLSSRRTSCRWHSRVPPVPGWRDPSSGGRSQPHRHNGRRTGRISFLQPEKAFWL